MSYTQYCFNTKKINDPGKTWIPGRSVYDVMNEIMRRTGIKSQTIIHSVEDMENYMLTDPAVSSHIIYIKFHNRNDVAGLLTVIKMCMKIMDDSTYVLVDDMFPYYKEFESNLHLAFVKARQEASGFLFNTLWDCSYGVGVIHKGEDQYCVFNTDDALNLNYEGFEYFFGLCMSPISTDMFINNILCKITNYKYAIITAIFNNYEMVREVENPRDDVEYVLVTDDPTITSTTWNVKLIDAFFDDMSGYAKAAYVKYHPFEFIESDVFIWVDGSIQIKEDFTDEIMMPFINSDYEILELANTITNKGKDEAKRWLDNEFHGFNKHQYDEIIKLFPNEEWVDEFQVQTTIYGGKNTRLLNKVNCRTWDLMRRNPGEGKDVAILYMPQRGMTIAKYIWNTHKVYILDTPILFSKYFDYCYHKSTESQREAWYADGDSLSHFVWGVHDNFIFPKKIK